MYKIYFPTRTILEVKAVNHADQIDEMMSWGFHTDF